MLASKGRTLASKGSMLSSKSNMLSCIILLAIEIEARVQLLARIRSVDAPKQDYMLSCIILLTILNLMLADITRQAFIKGLLAILIHEQ